MTSCTSEHFVPSSDSPPTASGQLSPPSSHVYVLTPLCNHRNRYRRFQMNAIPQQHAGLSTFTEPVIVTMDGVVLPGITAFVNWAQDTFQLVDNRCVYMLGDLSMWPSTGDSVTVRWFGMEPGSMFKF